MKLPKFADPILSCMQGKHQNLKSDFICKFVISFSNQFGIQIMKYVKWLPKSDLCTTVNNICLFHFTQKKTDHAFKVYPRFQTHIKSLITIEIRGAFQTMEMRGALIVPILSH